MVRISPKDEGGVDKFGASGLDNILVRQIATALTSRPLRPTQVAILKTWYDAPDWVHISALREAVVNSGLADNEKRAEIQVRIALSGFGARMSRNLPTSDDKHQTKLATLVDIRRERGSASHRLTSAGRKAVKIALKH